MPRKDREEYNAYMREYNKKNYKLPSCKTCGIEVEKKHQYCEEHSKGNWEKTDAGISHTKGYAKKWHLGNKERRNKDALDWKKNNPDKVLDYQYRTRYGITLNDYNDMKKNQKGNCFICGINEKGCKRKLAVDHCHVSGKVRALLCDECNRGLGGFKDDIDILASAISYLKNF